MSIEEQDMCTYRSCRHRHSKHGHAWRGANGKRYKCRCKHFKPADRPQRKQPIKETEDFKKLAALLDSRQILCRWCENPLAAYDIEQTDFSAQEPWTYVHCAKCKYDWAAWKIFGQVERAEALQLR